MSVSGVGYSRPLPLQRDLDDPGKRALIGRWIGRVNLSGDGSGGQYIANIIVAEVGKLYGPFALWDLKFFTWEFSGVIVPSYVTLRINAQERTPESGGLVPIWYVGAGTSGNSQYSLPSGLSDFKFRLSEISIYNTTVTLTVDPNTNGVILYFYAGGFIYDERYLFNN